MIFAVRSLPWNNPADLPPYPSRCRLLGMDIFEKRRIIMRNVFVAILLKGEIDAPAILARLNFNTVFNVNVYVVSFM